MCSVVLAAHVVAGYPLVVVANRDEQLDRASSPPLAWSGDGGVVGGGTIESAPFVAPRDDVAGGTWLGVNRAGVFVGITNRYLGPQDATRASRGRLVADALALGSARASRPRGRDSRLRARSSTSSGSRSSSPSTTRPISSRPRASTYRESATGRAAVRPSPSLPPPAAAAIAGRAAACCGPRALRARRRSYPWTSRL
jgi:hypothetical protein